MKDCYITNKEKELIGQYMLEFEKYNCVVEIINNQKISSITFKEYDSDVSTSYHKQGKDDYTLYNDGWFFGNYKLKDILEAKVQELKEHAEILES